MKIIELNLLKLLQEKRKGQKRENDGGGKSKIHCKHKHHDVSPVQILYMIKKLTKSLRHFRYLYCDHGSPFFLSQLSRIQLNDS
jgi:hypothetical protein